ncbi:F-box/WD repeat-containing protein 9 [Genypterus blacodes]|uniref:F-box/WD repeat-containing protein 9 n=1 Tax=Genypterus blacodes TaxID=154954 RepID=UPI003F75F806
MSQFGIEPTAGTQRDQDGSSAGPVGPSTSEPLKPDLPGLLPGGCSSSADISPSPSNEASSLLSLPWEMITQIASHLPAQCVITVLPQVCHTLGNVSKDSTSWQLRARRLTGSQANFPLGPREDFDWAKACLEMEQLITCWTDQAHLLANKATGQEGDGGRERQLEGAGEDGEAGPEQPEDGGEDFVEGAVVAVQEVAYAHNEGIEVPLEAGGGEMQPNIGEIPLERVREDFDVRLNEDAAALMEGERGQGVELDADQGRNGALAHVIHQDDLVGQRHQGNGLEGEANHQPPRSPSPPPALECVNLKTDHFANVNSVLLLGGEGTVCATASRDWNVKVWDLQAASEGTLLHTLGGHQYSHRGWVWCLASRGPQLASGSFDSTVKLWDLDACGAETGLIRTKAQVLCLSYQTDLLLAGTFDKMVCMYDTRAAEPLVKSLRLHANAVMSLVADDKYIISGSRDCTVVVYDRRAGKALKKIGLKSYVMSMSDIDNEIWAGDNRGMLYTFSMQQGVLKPISQFDVGHTALVTGVHRSAGSLYTCSTDGTVKVHIPCAPPRTLCTLHHKTGVNGLSVQAGVLAVASGDAGMCVKVWRPRK